MMIGTGLGMVDRDIEVGKEYKVGTFTLNGVTYDRYFKIVDCGALPSSSTSISVQHGITYTGILNTHGVAMNASKYVLPLPYITTSTTVVGYYIISDSITLMSASDLSNYHGYITVEYYR